jgi:glutaredoxin 3
MVTIFGKGTCPYTRAAREDYARRGVDVEYVNVKGSADAMARMLSHTNGRRDVPVIVDGNEVTIGFGGT